MQPPYRIIISGGGTGGHVYPAIAIANRLREIYPDIKLLFVGAKGRMEMERVPEAGYDIEGLWISGIQRKITVENLSFPFKLISSLLKSGKIIRRFKPHVVVGVGGFASGPLLFRATGMDIPALIQEQNSYPGITNKLLAKRVSKICVAYEGMDKFFPKEKIVMTGNPVRKDIIDVHKKRDLGFKHFNLQPDKKTVLVIGGSNGARTINQSIIEQLQTIEASDIQLIWQTGRFYYQDVKKAVEGYNLDNIRIYEFLKEMDLAYGAADLIVSRAGASTISELCLVGKPVIFIPSPNVAEDHQSKNAQNLVDRKAAMMVKDRDARKMLVRQAIEMLENEKQQAILKENIRHLAQPEATDMIVNEIMELIS